MLFVLLERVEFVFQVPHLGIVASRFGRLDFGFVLLNVLVDGFHGYEQVSQLTLRGALITVRQPFECDIF